MYDLDLRSHKRLQIDEAKKWSLVDDLIRAFDEVAFSAKVREKDTRVALANGSLMIKLVEFSISLRKSECNSVCLSLYTFLLVLGNLFIALVQMLGDSL